MNYIKRRSGETTTRSGLLLMAVTVGLQLMTAFGVDITAEQHAAIIAAASVVIAIALIVWPDKVAKDDGAKQEKKCNDYQHF